jgi:hypothetical protein
MLANLTPPEVNDLLAKGGGFANGNMMISQKASEILGLDFHGRIHATLPYPQKVCIAETNKYAPYVPQHFFVWLGHDDLIWDPLDGKEKVNPYPLVSFRLFDPKPTPITDPSESDIAFDLMKLMGVYTTFTQRNSPVNTDQLAIFLSRYDQYLEKKLKIS